MKQKTFTDDEDDEESEMVLAELENIDDECDQNGITFVKIDNDEEAKEYGLDDVPVLVYFEKGIPSVYIGNWRIKQFGRLYVHLTYLQAIEKIKVYIVFQF